MFAPKPQTTTPPTNNPTDLVEVNVGGLKFQTTLKTLLSIPFFSTIATKEISTIPTIKTRKQPSVETIKQTEQINPFQVNPFLPKTTTYPTTGITNPTTGHGTGHGTINPTPLLLTTATTEDKKKSEFSHKDYLSIDEEGNLFVDLNGELFICILDWIRYSKVPEISIHHLNVKQLMKLKNEALFYGLVDLSEACNKRLLELGKNVTPTTTTQPSGTNIGVQPTNTISGGNVQLVKVQMKCTNKVLESLSQGKHEHITIRDSVVEFETKQPGHLLIEYSIADCSGDFIVVIDKERQSVQPALSGMKINEVVLQYALTQNLSYVTPKIIQPGNHTVELLWRPYLNTGYNIQGPLVAKVYLILDSSVVNIKV